MSLQIGNDKIEDIYYGSDKIQKVYYGNELVYSKEYQIGDLYKNYGVVFYIDSFYYYVVGFVEHRFGGYRSEEYWLHGEEDTPVPNKTLNQASIDFNGKDYTAILVNYGGADAADAAHNHPDINNHPVGTYYLPALGELFQLLNTSTMEIINPKLNAAGGDPVFNQDFYWSSSEADVENSWQAQSSIYGGVQGYAHNKAYNSGYVRPITKFLK